MDVRVFVNNVVHTVRETELYHLHQLSLPEYGFRLIINCSSTKEISSSFIKLSSSCYFLVKDQKEYHSFQFINLDCVLI